MPYGGFAAWRLDRQIPLLLLRGDCEEEEAMAQSTTVEGVPGAETKPGTRSLLVWDPHLGPGFILAVITLAIGFSCVAPEVDRRIGRLEDGQQVLQKGQQALRERVGRLEEGQQELRENQERIIEKVDEVLEVVGER